MLEELGDEILKRIRSSLAMFLDAHEVAVSEPKRDVEGPGWTSDVTHDHDVHQESRRFPIPLLEGVNPDELHVRPDRQLDCFGRVRRCNRSPLGKLTPEHKHVLTYLQVVRGNVSDRREAIHVELPVLPRGGRPSVGKDQPVKLTNIIGSQSRNSFCERFGVLKG